jgi:pyrimidine-nucleoside phosphorylase
MYMPELIRKKRDGGELTAEEISYIINGCVSEEVPDYQLSAFAMAVFFRGMTKAETVALTLAMRDSGDKADLSGISGVKVDKHSTGGVGDKTTLIVAPIVAACGVKVAKMSGRGLGHTGGTVDKLEAIPGFQTSISPQKMRETVESCGLSVTGQSGNMCPADKKLYALRDVTATVDSIPLIASSIMSKKLADGSDCILLDVKTGSGSFMKTLDDSRLLARKMVDIGRGAGVKTAALITNMDAPLGKAVGNSLEVIESVDILKGNTSGDLWTVCRELSCRMLMLAGIGDREKCAELVDEAVGSGEALRRFEMMVKSQGGDVSYIENTSKFEKASFSREVYAPADGYITHMDSENIGLTAVLLGAGREKKEDNIDPAAGIVISAKTGDFVKHGELLATLFSNDKSRLDGAETRYLSAVSIGAQKPAAQPMILDYID